MKTKIIILVAILLILVALYMLALAPKEVAEKIVPKVDLEGPRLAAQAEADRIANLIDSTWEYRDVGVQKTIPLKTSIRFEDKDLAYELNIRNQLVIVTLLDSPYEGVDATATFGEIPGGQFEVREGVDEISCTSENLQGSPSLVVSTETSYVYKTDTNSLHIILELNLDAANNCYGVLNLYGEFPEEVYNKLPAKQDMTFTNMVQERVQQIVDGISVNLSDLKLTMEEHMQSTMKDLVSDYADYIEDEEGYSECILVERAFSGTFITIKRHNTDSLLSEDKTGTVLVFSGGFVISCVDSKGDRYKYAPALADFKIDFSNALK